MRMTMGEPHLSCVFVPIIEKYSPASTIFFVTNAAQPRLLSIGLLWIYRSNASHSHGFKTGFYQSSPKYDHLCKVMYYVKHNTYFYTVVVKERNYG